MRAETGISRRIVVPTPYKVGPANVYVLDPDRGRAPGEDRC